VALGIDYGALCRDRTLRVDDLNIGSGTRVVFILESPHTEEVKQGVPVAGASGKAMTRFLFGGSGGPPRPLGPLVKEHLGDGGCADSRCGRIRGIGVMNVSPVPLQAAFYERTVRNHNRRLTALLESARRSAALFHHRDPELNRIEEHILGDFRSRLAGSIRVCGALYVVCGAFAGMYFDAAKRDAGIPPGRILRVPHPAYNSWDRGRTNESLAELKRLFAAGMRYV
jgi:hypothetical protein